MYTRGFIYIYSIYIIYILIFTLYPGAGYLILLNDSVLVGRVDPSGYSVSQVVGSNPPPPSVSALGQYFVW